LIGSAANLELAEGLRAASSISSVPDITTFDDVYPDWPVDPASLLDLIDLHHPYMTRLNLIGAENSLELHADMEKFAFVPAESMWPRMIAFRRPIPVDVYVPTLHLAAAAWNTRDDVYDSLFAAIGAPEWHGRNFAALNDSIVTGSINGVEVPYSLVIEGLDSASVEAREFSRELLQLIDEFENVGCPVSIRVH